MRRRGAALQRLLHVDGEPVLVGDRPAGARPRAVRRARRDARPPRARASRGCASRPASTTTCARSTTASRGDPVIGRAVRATPACACAAAATRGRRCCGAITEQLIEFERAVAIQRRLIAAFGHRCPATGLRDAPTPAAIAAQAPARLASFDLAPKRALALRRCAEAVAARAARPARPRPAAAARRCARSARGRSRCSRCTARAATTVVPAGDLGFLKLVGRLTTGNPKARADEAEVRGFFAPYGEWKGLAGEYLMHAAPRGLIRAPMSPGRAPRPAGTRWSAAAGRPAAA